MAARVRLWKGSWYVFINHNRQRKSKCFGKGPTAKRVAEDAKRKIDAKLALGDLGILDNGHLDSPRFGDVAEEWLDRHAVLRSIRPSTLENYRSFTRHHLIPFFGRMPVAAITADVIEEFVTAKRAAGGSARFSGRALSGPSLRTGLMALRLILQRAVRAKILPANPMLDLALRLRADDDDNVDPFTVAELRAIFAAAHELDRDFETLLRLWAQAGPRAGEVLGLTHQELDLDKGRALIERTWSRGRLGPTKSGRSRLVSILHPVAQDTTNWKPGSTEESFAVLAGLRRLKIRNLDTGGFVFGKPPAPMRSSELHRQWRRVLVAAGVRYRSPEQLRHTFASVMLVAERAPAVCATAGRLAKRGRPASGLREMDASGARGDTQPRADDRSASGA